MHQDKWPIGMMCKVLEVSPSAYYAWRKEPFGKRHKQSCLIRSNIERIYYESKGRYGSPRIAKEMTNTGLSVSRRTIAKYMKQMGLKSKLSRKYRQTIDYSHKEPVAENILNRDFVSKYPGIKCVSDITYLPTTHGFIYLTVVIDLFDRQPIGWNISERMTAEQTIIPALEKASRNRSLQKYMIFHSDRGVQYACKTTVNYLKSCNFSQSMSRKGNCWDNAVAESFFKTLKTELIYGNKLLSKLDTKTAVFEYLETWYNKKRRHSYLNYLTIPEFWEQYENNNLNITP